jgi:hypothetical protein
MESDKYNLESSDINGIIGVSKNEIDSSNNEPSMSSSPGDHVRIFYRLFKCFAKRVIMHNKYYDVIFGNMYTTDGRRYISRYDPEDNIDDVFYSDSINPDCVIKLICGCYCCCIFCCENVFEERHTYIHYDASMNIIAEYHSEIEACKALKVDRGKLFELCKEEKEIKCITIKPLLNLD